MTQPPRKALAWAHGILAVERFLPSAVMGLVLGWVRWRGGSIWPGVLLHVAHNGLLISAALFPDLFRDMADGASHVPITWLAAAGVGVGAGLLLTLLARKNLAGADET